MEISGISASVSIQSRDTQHSAENIGRRVIENNDSDGDGESGPGEAIYPNAYKSWTPSSLKAAYNFQYASKDPGGFAHNASYVIQLLIDSIEAVGGSTGSFTRP